MVTSCLELHLFTWHPPVTECELVTAISYWYTAWCNEIGSLTSLMHVTQVHPVTTENQFHCTKLYKRGWILGSLSLFQMQLFFHILTTTTTKQRKNIQIENAKSKRRNVPKPLPAIDGTRSSDRNVASRAKTTICKWAMFSSGLCREAEKEQSQLDRAAVGQIKPRSEEANRCKQPIFRPVNKPSGGVTVNFKRLHAHNQQQPILRLEVLAKMSSEPVQTLECHHSYAY